MINIEAVKNASPDEGLLCELIETDLMGVVLDECITEDQLESIINSVYLYKRGCGGRIKVFAAGEHNNTPYIRKLMEGYAAVYDFEFVRAMDKDRLLTCFLGSEAIITSDPDSSCAGLAKEFCVPRLCFSDKKDYRFADGVLYVSSEPSSISAALMVIKERKYADELSGLRSLNLGGRL